VHTSPACRQNDEAAQTPFAQFSEQHCEACVHALPSVAQVELSAVHLPVVQTPLQHWVPLVHDAPSDVHAGRAHTPPVHVPVQQVPAAVHAAPTLRQFALPASELAGAPHFEKPPPPQNCGKVQDPQLRVPPQPSPAVPQSYPSCAQVVGVQSTPPSGPNPVLPPQVAKPPPPQ
jgi:hypothetical protein